MYQTDSERLQKGCGRILPHLCALSAILLLTSCTAPPTPQEAVGRRQDSGDRSLPPASGSLPTAPRVRNHRQDLADSGTLSERSESKGSQPGVLLSIPDLARLRGELRSTPWKRLLYEGAEGRKPLLVHGVDVLVGARDWVDRPVEIPGRGGHFHHFFCDDGTRLTLPPDNRPSPDGYPCPSCGRRYTGERFDACVRWKIHNELSSVAFDLALAWSLEKDVRYARKASEILTKYAAAYPGPHTSSTEGGILLQSLCESVWIIPLAWTYDLVRDSGVLSDAERAAVVDRLFRPVAGGLRATCSKGNWASWQLSAVGVVGFAIGDKGLQDWAIDRFKAQIRDELGDDGLWPESVHTYHFYPLRAFLFLAEAARNHGIDLYSWTPADSDPATSVPGSSGTGTGTHTGTGTKKGLRAMFSAPLRYMYPDFRLPAINDGWFQSFLLPDLYELAYARYGDPEFGWALKAGYARMRKPREGLWTLLHGRPLDRDFPAPVLRSTDFPVLGIAVLRSPSGSMMTFDYGPHLGHGQHDKMGITLFAGGKLWAADYGTPGYGSAALPWYRGTPGHNTVVVDGKDQRGTKERRMTFRGGTSSLEAVEAETEQAYPGVLHRRSVLRIDDDFLVIDRLESDSPHDYDWFFRSEGTLRLDGEPPISPPEPSPYPFVRIERTARFDGPWSAGWTQGDDRLRLHLLDAAPSLVFRAECPAETTTRTVPLLIARRTGKTATFTAALLAEVRTANAECRMNEGLVMNRRGDTTDWIYTGGATEKSPLRTDGRFAWVREQSDRPVRVAVLGGRFVEWKGKRILESPAPGDTEQ